MWIDTPVISLTYLKGRQFKQLHKLQCGSSLKILIVSRYMTKPTKSHVRPAKTQISLGIHPVWSVFAVPSWVARDPSFLHADSEDSDQTGWMPRLIWVLTGRSYRFVGSVVLRLVWDHKKSRCNRWIGPRHEKMRLREFATRLDSNHTAQLQKVARVSEFWI